MNQRENSIQIINHNFLHHSTFLQSQTAGMRAHHRDGVSWSDSGLNCDTFNILYITDHNTLSDASLQEVIDHYRQNDLAFCAWINEENLSPAIKSALERSGLQEAGSEPGMILELEAFQHTPAAADISKLNTRSGLQQFAHIVSLNWNPPDKDVARFYERVAETVLHPSSHIAYYASFIDNKPVSVVEVFPDNAYNAGIYSVCTLKEFRGRGIATDLMKFCLQQLKNAGYRTATLQAADDGLNIYKKLGFTASTRFYEFKP
ncbi:MAG TPA: GNAT family N-acetyltransferase [Chitinophagaceae bacterium]|nr:GNAT family N-acetyltransferase [Chitinophagaceae bacterium]